jgi:hypothetical protein
MLVYKCSMMHLFLLRTCLGNGGSISSYKPLEPCLLRTCLNVFCIGNMVSRVCSKQWIQEGFDWK